MTFNKLRQTLKEGVAITKFIDIDMTQIRLFLLDKEYYRLGKIYTHNAKNKSEQEDS